MSEFTKGDERRSSERWMRKREESLGNRSVTVIHREIGRGTHQAEREELLRQQRDGRRLHVSVAPDDGPTA
ncbi:hypothetical protein LIA77_04388 [Sarocladium implicatum]|nr:hypothetical protein LIA77_04388 [Sarocladium implicatum]